MLIELKHIMDIFDFATIGRQVNLNWYENIHIVNKSPYERPWSAVKYHQVIINRLWEISFIIYY